MEEEKNDKKIEKIMLNQTANTVNIAARNFFPELTPAGTFRELCIDTSLAG